MKIKSQAGFSVVEVLLLVVLVLGIGGVGYYVWHANKSALAPSSSDVVKQSSYQSPPVSTVSAPQVTKASDLSTAYQALNQTSVNSNNTDSSQLTTQSNGL